jgi:L-lactate dehydrogenase (cytochrome)
MMEFRRPPLYGPRLRGVFTIEDLRRVARMRLPKGVFDFIDGGAEDEHTLANNRSAFDQVSLMPNTMRDVSNVDTSVKILGQITPLPIIIGPAGFTGAVHRDGELHVAEVAARKNLPYVVPTMSNVTLENIAAHSSGVLWFQLYPWRDKGLTRELVDRAYAAGYQALVVTVDVPIAGQRERDLRNGMVMPPKISPATIFDGIRKPRWTTSFLNSPKMNFANVADLTPKSMSTMDFVAQQFDPSFSLKDLEWLISSWPRKLIVKGVLTSRDAVAVESLGASAVVVSNHGGRQLDKAISPLDALLAIVDSAGSDFEIFLDSGIRRGTDMAIALAMGAKAVLVARPYLYGLGAAGEHGVDVALSILEKEFRRTLMLLGVNSSEELTRDLLSK